MNRLSVILLALALILSTNKTLALAARDQTPSAATTKLTALCNNFLKKAELKNSLVGLEIMQLPSGQVLFDYNGQRRFVPASVAKVFTTACALDTLGPDFVYHTKLMASGQVKGDRLKGDLLIAGCQDPTFQSQDLRKLLQELIDHKIRKIDGSIKFSTPAGGSDYFNPGWLTEDWGQDWMPVSSSLVIDRNLANNNGPGRGLLAAMPDNPEQAETADALQRSLMASDMAPGWAYFNPLKQSVETCRLPGTGVLVITNPSAYNLAYIKALAKSMNIHVSGSKCPEPGALEELCQHDSKPLSRIINWTLQKSDNLYAQQILRTLGQDKASSATGNLEQRGLATIQNWLATIGVQSNETILLDGCGLSRKDCLSPHSLNMVLKHMSGQNLDGKFLSLLHSSGSGRGSYRFKTGTMDSVRCITGVARTEAGDALAVTIMVNGHTPSIRNLANAEGELTQTIQALSLKLPDTGAAPAQSDPPNVIAQPKGHRRHRLHR